MIRRYRTVLLTLGLALGAPLALALIVADVSGKEAVSETAPISLGQYIDKVVSSHEVTESSLKGSLIKYLDASDVKTKRLFGDVTFSRTGGFTFDGDVSVDSIMAFLSGDTIYYIKFNFSSGRCITINELDAIIGAFSGHYPPPVDSRDSSIFEMQHISSNGMTLYRASLTKSKFVLVPSCVNGLSVTLEQNK